MESITGTFLKRVVLNFIHYYISLMNPILSKKKKVHVIYLTLLVVCAVIVLILFPSLLLLLPFFAGFILLVAYAFTITSLNKTYFESLSLEDKILHLRKKVTFKDTLPYVVTISMLFLLGSFYVNTIAPLFFIPFFFLVATFVVKLLNRDAGVEDEIDKLKFEVRYNQLKKENNTRYDEREAELQPEDIQKLKTEALKGDQKMIERMVANNKKIVLTGCLTDKLDYEGECYWTIGEKTRIDVPHEIFNTVRIGELIYLEAVKPQYATISTHKNFFVLKLTKLETVGN